MITNRVVIRSPVKKGYTQTCVQPFSISLEKNYFYDLKGKLLKELTIKYNGHNVYIAY